MLEIILVAIFTSTVLNLLLKKINIPTIIGYIATGIIIAYLFQLHGIKWNYELHLIAEFGIVFLMFTIGLEFSVKHLLKMKKDVFIIGWLQVLLTALIFYLVIRFGLWFDTNTAIIIWAWFSLSSTAIVLKILNETRDINKEYWQKVLGILLFQDLAIIPILLLIWVLWDNWTSVWVLLWDVLLSTILLIFLLWVVWRYFLNVFFEKISISNSSELFIGAIFLIVLGSSYLSHHLWLWYSLGGLIAGILIAETQYKHRVEADLSPFRDLLLGVFFITVGMQLDFAIIIENIHYILLFLPLIFFVKIVIIFLLARFWSKGRTAFKSALSIFQIGEFAIVIFELASVESLIENQLSQILIIMVIISMITTPFILNNITFITNFLSRFLPNYDQCSVKSDVIDTIKNYDIVLIGFGRLGKVISESLDQKWLKHLIIEGNHSVFKKWKNLWKNIIFWNAHQKHLLKSIDIRKASNIIVSVWNNEKLYLICEALTSMAPESRIIVKANKYEEKEMLLKLNLTNILVETEETALSMLREIEK